MSSSLILRAESALARGEPGRAAILARLAATSGNSRSSALRIEAEALAGVLIRTGIVTAGLGPGSVDPQILRDAPHALAVEDVVRRLQQVLEQLARERESTALERKFKLAESLMYCETIRVPEPGPAHAVVITCRCDGRPEPLERLLKSLIASDCEPAELVLLADASADPATLELLAGIDARPHRLHALSNRGFASRSWAACQNAMIDFARQNLGHFEHLVICSDRLRFAPDWWSAVRGLQSVLGGVKLFHRQLGATTALKVAGSSRSAAPLRVGGFEFSIGETIDRAQLVLTRNVLNGVLGRLDYLEERGWSARLRAAGCFVAGCLPARAAEAETCEPADPAEQQRSARLTPA